MAIAHGTLAQPVDVAEAAVRRAASQKGYALAEGRSGPGTLVFTRGMSAFSWGSTLTVGIESTSPSATHLTITTGETFALFDWGRGKREAHRLLAAAGATATDQ
jgi:hypothetical protein